MSKLLLELFSEEMPSREQQNAVCFIKEHFAKLIEQYDVDKKFIIKSFVTPRRIVLLVENLPAKIKTEAKRIRGPEVNANPKAVEGFLKKYNLSDKKDLLVEKIKDKKYYFFQEKELLKSFSMISKDILEKLILDMAKKAFAKTMRWGNYKIRWIRPLQNILCLFDDKVLAIKYGHLKANNISYGHRFLGKKIIVNSNLEYFAKLAKEYVVLDQEERKELIVCEIEKICTKHKFVLNEDKKLLDEVAGLIEYPNLLLGKIDEKFMDLPEEILITTLRNHQKYFCVRDKNGKLLPYFLFVAGIKSTDDKIIIEGNQKVIKARLDDARYFYEEDKKIKIEERLEMLKNITFHQKIGNLSEKSDRNAKIATSLSLWISNAHPVDVEVASKIAKIDLTSQMVQELPELQGIMGYYYAKNEHISHNVALAIKEHYLPQGLKDKVPNATISVLVSLADKIDSLVGFILVKETPKGSRDPYGVRRLAISIIRIILENKLHLPLNIIIDKTFNGYFQLIAQLKKSVSKEDSKNLIEDFKEEVRLFINNRFKILVQNENINENIIDAVWFLDKNHDLLEIYKKVKILNHFVQSSKGKEVLEVYKRASRIYKKAEKEDDANYVKRPLLLYLKTEEDKNLYHTYKDLKSILSSFTKKGDYKSALNNLEYLIAPINIFFDNVIVNDENIHLKHNRLKLLASICYIMNKVSDFSKI